METPNINYVHDISGGDQDFERQLITILKKEFPAELKEYESAMEIKDFALAAEKVHKIRHKISIFGLEEGFALSEEYENQLKLGKPENLKDNFEQLLKIINRFIKKL